MRAIAVILALILCGCSKEPREKVPKYEVAVLSALPLFWSKANPTMAVTKADERAPIIRDLSEIFIMTPIDLVDDQTLRRHRLLMLAQPRALSGAELVAIDAWVRAGGRLLIFADPALTWSSSYALGDPRRPPVMTLLDPLFTHWGLKLLLPAVRVGEETCDMMLANMAVAVSAPGQWQNISKACETVDSGLRALCRLGKGRVELVADADVLDVAGLGVDGSANSAAVTAILRRLTADLPAPISESSLEQDKNKLTTHPESDRKSRQLE